MAFTVSVPDRLAAPLTTSESWKTAPTFTTSEPVPEKVMAPVRSVAKLPAVRPAPGAMLPCAATVPATVPRPPSVAPLATVTALPAAVLPLTVSVPPLTVVEPVYPFAPAKINVPVPNTVTEFVPFARMGELIVTAPLL